MYMLLIHDCTESSGEIRSSTDMLPDPEYSLKSPLRRNGDYLISVAASNIFSCTPDSPATKWACTPKGSVMLPLVTWPDFNPYTTGTSYSARTRMITCCKV